MIYNSKEISCATCDGWQRFAETSGEYDTRFGKCPNSVKVYAYTVQIHEGRKPKTDIIYTEGQLITGEDFCCIHHPEFSRIKEIIEQEAMTS